MKYVLAIIILIISILLLFKKLKDFLNELIDFLKRKEE